MRPSPSISAAKTDKAPSALVVTIFCVVSTTGEQICAPAWTTKKVSRIVLQYIMIKVLCEVRNRAGNTVLGFRFAIAEVDDVAFDGDVLATGHEGKAGRVCELVNVSKFHAYCL